MSKHERFTFQDKASFLEKCQKIGVDLPFSDSFDILFQPLKIGGNRVGNRFAVHPMEGFDAGPDGSPGDLTFRRYARYASGGSTLIWFEATAVVEAGKSNPHQLHLHAKNVDAFKRLVESTRREAHQAFGNNHDLLLILQLTHSGRYAKPMGKPAPVIGHHHPFLDEKQKIASDFPVISDDGLDAMQDRFIEAALLAESAGFNGVDIKACHHYLVSELLAAFTRNDSKYGGSFENRTRFLTESVQKIQDATNGLIVTSRLNAYDGLVYPYGFGVSREDSRIEDLTETQDLIQRLIDRGLVLLNLSIGNPYVIPHYCRPFDQPLKNTAVPDEHPLEGVNRLLKLTAALQRKFRNIPFVGTGYSWLRQFIPHVGGAMIKEGKAALLGLGRSSFAYPDLPRDLMQGKKVNVKKTCITCSLCTQLMRLGGPTGCVARDKEIYARVYRAKQ